MDDSGFVLKRRQIGCGCEKEPDLGALGTHEEGSASTEKERAAEEAVAP